MLKKKLVDLMKSGWIKWAKEYFGKEKWERKEKFVESYKRIQDGIVVNRMRPRIDGIGDEG